MPADRPPTPIAYDYAGAIAAALDAHPDARYLAVGEVPRKGAPPPWKALKRHKVSAPPPDKGRGGSILLFPRSIGAPYADEQGRIEVWRFRTPIGLAPAAAEEAPAAALDQAPEPAAPEPDHEAERLEEEDAAHLEALRPKSEDLAVSTVEDHLRYLTMRGALQQGRQVPQILDATTRLIAQIERNEAARHDREMQLRQRVDDLEQERGDEGRGGNLANILGSVAMALGPFVRAGVADRLAQRPQLLAAAPTPQDGQALPSADPAPPIPAPLAALLADPTKLQQLLADPAALEVLAKHGLTG